MTKTFTLTAIGLIFAATAAAAGDGHEGQKNVYRGLQPAQSVMAPLENRVAMQSSDRGFERRTAAEEGQANIRIQSLHSERSLAGFGN